MGRTKQGRMYERECQPDHENRTRATCHKLAGPAAATHRINAIVERFVSAQRHEDSYTGEGPCSSYLLWVLDVSSDVDRDRKQLLDGQNTKLGEQYAQSTRHASTSPSHVVSPEISGASGLRKQMWLRFCIRETSGMRSIRCSSSRMTLIYEPRWSE